MADETKVAEVPAPEKVETTDKPVDDKVIDNRRAEIENLVIAENTAPEEPKPESPEEPKTEEKVDPLEKIKKSVQKRIDKVVAQKKTAEEELVEARQEIDRLKSRPTEVLPTQDDKTPPTIEQVEQYIVKMREEGNAREEIAATRYMIKLEKEEAIKQVRDEQAQVGKQADEVKKQQLTDWMNLSRDYIAYDSDGKIDTKSDLNLDNKSGMLYTTALSLYNDKELHADYYDDPNTIQGFRRAVADAYREIHQQGLIKTPKGEQLLVKERSPREVLADPDADTTEEPNQSGNQAPLSNADKVRAEIKARKGNRLKRRLPQ